MKKRVGDRDVAYTLLYKEMKLLLLFCKRSFSSMLF